MPRAAYEAMRSRLVVKPARSTQRVVIPDDYPGPACKLWVSEHGDILDCCELFCALFGYRPEELIGRHISVLIPGLAGVALRHQDRVNPQLAFMRRCATPFQTVDRNGICGSCTLFVNIVTPRQRPGLVVIVRTQPLRANA